MTSSDIIEKAAEIIRRGGIIIYPTETVYGLGANALSPESIKKVYEMKERPPDMPLSLAVSSYEMVDRLAIVDSWSLIRKILPGPVTILLKKRDIVPDILTAGSPLVGIRYPDHAIPQRIIELAETPITSTSANLSGTKPPSSPEEVDIQADIIVSGGECRYSQPSTIIDLTTNKILRKGAQYPRVLGELQKL